MPSCDAIRKLSHLLRQVEQPTESSKQTRITTGCPPLDQLLKPQGLARGSLVEWLGDGPGNGVNVLALLAAREACRDGGSLVVIDRDEAFYPPAASAWQIDLQNTIVIRPQNDKDEYWTLDQTLRCEHVAAVLAWPKRIDHYTFRRLKLAAKGSGCLGLFVRPLAARNQPSCADVRLLVSPQVSTESWRLHVQLLRCWSRFGAGETELEINDRTGEIHKPHLGDLAPQLARSATGEHSA